MTYGSRLGYPAAISETMLSMSTLSLGTFTKYVVLLKLLFDSLTATLLPVVFCSKRDTRSPLCDYTNVLARCHEFWCNYTKICGLSAWQKVKKRATRAFLRSNPQSGGAAYSALNCA